MKKNLKGKVLNIKTVAKDTVRLDFSTVLKDIRPGQFVSILTPKKTLRRPFSAADFSVSGEEGAITVIFKLKGEGTNYLKSLKIGDTVDYLAPLGNGFTLPRPGEKALLIGAGIGIAPMLYLKKVLNKNSYENLLISGFKTEDEVVEGSDTTVIGGSVLDNIQSIIDEFKPKILYSCGPRVVLKMVAEIAEKNGIKSEIAMEKVMACGIGVCRGCVIHLKRGSDIVNASVCADGPVFSGKEVIWED